MYDIYVGKQRSIVFPIMCNAHININYADNIVDFANNNNTTDDVPYGLWGHSGSFTYEAIFTPYDINGMGVDGARERSVESNSDFIMPKGFSGGGSPSNEYLSIANRYSHSMALFHNTNLTISLQNTTTTNNNQPAEYKIKVDMKINGVNQTFETGTVISAISDKTWLKGNVENNYNYQGIDANGRIKYEAVGFTDGAMTAGNQPFPLNLNGSRTNHNTFFIGQKLFVDGANDFEYIEIGTVTFRPSSGDISITPATVDVDSGKPVYIEPFKEPKYIKNMHHVAVVFNEFDNIINIFYNGGLVHSSIHNTSGIFTFDRTDCLIGRNTTNGSTSASTASQYMGEIHEMSIERGTKKKITYTNSLFPFYDNSLLYLRFEEVDE
jgi:hypothetical protein